MDPEKGTPAHDSRQDRSTLNRGVSRIGQGSIKVAGEGGKHLASGVRNQFSELAEVVTEDHKRRAFFYPHHYLMGTTEGQFIFLLGMAFVLIAAGMAAWIAIGGSVAAGADTSLEQSFWISWGLFFDPGTQTGVPADDPWAVKITAMSFSIAGFIFNLAFLGLIVDLVRTTLGSWKHKFARIVASDHILILGWSDKTLFLLNEVVEMRANRAVFKGPIWLRPFSFCRPGKKIVILAERDALQMQEEVKMHFHFSTKKERERSLGDKMQFWKSADSSHDMKDIHFREGDPASRTELMKVSAHKADALLLSSCGSMGKADEKTVQTLLAIAALPTPTQGKVVAEMQSEEGLNVVSQILPQEVSSMGIFARQTVNRMMLLRGLVPTVGFTYMELGSFSTGSEIYAKEVPVDLVGKTMKEIAFRYEKAILLAVMEPGSKEVLGVEGSYKRVQADLAKHVLVDPDRLVKEKDLLILLAKNSQDCKLYDKKADYANRKVTKVPDSVSIKGKELRATLQAYEAAKIENKKGQLVLGSQCKNPMTVAMVGCPADFTNFLSMMNEYLAPGSHVYLLSERTIDWRVEAQKRAFGLAYKDFRTREEDGAPQTPQGGEPPEDDDGMVDRTTYEHFSLHHRIGSTTSMVDLRGLPHEEFDCILVLSDSTRADEEPSESDSRMLITVLTLTTVRNEIGKELILEGKKLKDRCKVCTELLDPKSRHVVENNKKVRKCGSYVYSASNETGLFAMAAHDPIVYALAMGLMDPSSGLGHIVSVQARDFVEGEERLSYYDMRSRVREACGGILLGWQRVGDGHHPKLNPDNKSDKYLWSSEDRPEETKDKKQDMLIIFMTNTKTKEPARALGAPDAAQAPQAPVVDQTPVQEMNGADKANSTPVVPQLPGAMGLEPEGLDPPSKAS